MASAGSQIKLLLWKDYLIRKRKLITLGGVIWATLVLSSLYIVRTNIDNQDFATCQFPARALPSAGMVTFLQSFICSLNNECKPMDQYEEIPSYEQSRLTQLQRQLSPLLSNESVLETAAAMPRALQLVATLADVVDEPTFLYISKNGLLVKDLFKNPLRVVENILLNRLDLTQETAVGIMRAEISLQNIIRGTIDKCDPKSLSQILVTTQEVIEELVEATCPLSDEELQAILLETVLEIDVGKYVRMLGNMYTKLSGDQRLTELSDTLTAFLRMTKLDSFVPPELISIVGNVRFEDFHYYNLTIVTKILDLFEPTFGDTEVYKSIRGFAETATSSVQWLHKIITRNKMDSINEATGIVLQQLKGELNIGNVNDAILELNNAVAVKQDGGMTVDEIFDLFAKASNFILKWLPQSSKHQTLFYSTLLAKLFEAAHGVIIDNVNLPEKVFNVSVKNPDAMKVIMGLPVQVIGRGFDGLADPDRLQVMTSKINTPNSMFCDENRLQKFFNMPKKDISSLKAAFCTDVWKKYIGDIIVALGINRVKNNINGIASILIQETLGKDTTDQLYTMEQDFEVLKRFTKGLVHISSEQRPEINWPGLFNASENSDFFKKMKEKGRISKQVLISVHGALAKEIVKQNTILDIKISPILNDFSTILQALNGQLRVTPTDVAFDFKRNYPQILLSMLTTLMDEEKTYKLLSTHSETVFCNGLENAEKYFTMPEQSDKQIIVTSICKMAGAIEVGLRKDSIIGKSMEKLLSTKADPSINVDWTKLINEIKALYIKLEKDYPYVFEITSYNMTGELIERVNQLTENVKGFWFTKKSMARSLHICLKALFRGLDLLDREIFNLTDDVWIKTKHALNSANGLLVIMSEFFKLIADLSANKEVTSDLPRSTVLALKSLLPNLPQLVIDGADLIVSDGVDLNKITDLLNANPPWPCSNTSISQHLNLTEDSRLAVSGFESLLCMNSTLRDEWLKYGEAQKVRIIMSLPSADNKTSYEPHVFLKFSNNFDEVIKNADNLKETLEMVFNDNSVKDKPTLNGAWKYAVGLFNRTDRNVVFGDFFSKIDTVLNSVNTSDISDSVPLNILWEDTIKCMNSSDVTNCSTMNRATWKYSLQFLSVMAENVLGDLDGYFREINEPNVTIIQVLGFTRGTGLYVLYDKMADFLGVLLNSYWDYGFMNQIRRASKSQFWDCESVVGALVVPVGSRVTSQDVARVRPYVCPSLLYWVSLPRNENAFLDVVSKPQYLFYTMQVNNLTSDYANAFKKLINLTEALTEVSHKNNTETVKEKDLQINSIKNKIENFVDYVSNWKVNQTDTSYKLFSEINKKQFTTSVYLTRVITVLNKILTNINRDKFRELIKDLPEDEMKKLEADVLVIEKKFKRKPSEAIATHFDIITDLLWKNDVKLVEVIEKSCKETNASDTNILLEEDKRFLTQICAKNYQVIYGALENLLGEDLKKAKYSLKNLVEMLSDGEEVEDIFQFFTNRKELLKPLKHTIKYADDLSLPIYLKYLHTNLNHYNLVLAFLTGSDWWSELRRLYNGPNADLLLGTVEHSLEIADDFINHLDQIHLVRLLRDMNINDTDSFCLPNITLSDYFPDESGNLSKVKRQICEVDQTELFKELPMMVIVSQGYDNTLQLSSEIDYDQLNSDLLAVETRLKSVMDGPKAPTRPKWVREENLGKLKKTLKGILSKEMLTKISFGFMSNVIDGLTLFLNNSQCQVCSILTTWFKQLNLQLFKKQDYDVLLCHVSGMALADVHHVLNNEFHWDMALKELISTRNYTTYELNKAVTEFLEQVKLHVLDDVTSAKTKLADCLAANVTRNAVGNVTLFVSVLSKTLKLIRSETPHISEVDGMKDVPYLNELHNQIAHKLKVVYPLKEILKTEDLKGKMKFEKLLIDAIGTADVDLLMLKNDPFSIRKSIKLQDGDWNQICQQHNCTEISMLLNRHIDKDFVDKKLQELQSNKFWEFTFVSDALARMENIFVHASRMLGVASRMDIVSAFNGDIAAMLDLVLQVLQENNANDILYSLRGIIEEIQPLLEDTPLEFDLKAISRGLDIVSQYRTQFVNTTNLKVPVSQLFSTPDLIESDLNRLGINNTNFWSIAAPRIHGGEIDFIPLLKSPDPSIRIRTFVCTIEGLSNVLTPVDLGVVSMADVGEAVVEQFCELPDETVKQVIKVLFGNMNYSFVIDKVTNILLTQLYKASNLTQQDGAIVLSKYKDMMALFPVVQQNVGNLTGVLAQEPIFEAFKDFSGLGGLLSSSKFLSSAGNMLCGTPFSGGGNRFYKAIAETQDFSNLPDPEQLAVLPTDFCRSLYKDVLKMSGGKIVWSFVKPLIMGKILYTPDTPIVRRIIERANTSFSRISRVTDILHNFASSFPYVEGLSHHKSGVSALLSLASSPIVQEMLMVDLAAEDIGYLDVDSLFDEFGDLEGIGSLLTKASNLLRCVNLNRFLAAPTEGQLAKEAVTLTRVNEFAAGVVFLDVKEDQGRPMNVEYKIRMDIDSVPTTTRIRNQFWTPGPESSFLEDMRYFRGFVQVQDLIDKAIIELTQNNTSRRKRNVEAVQHQDYGEYGVYTQQIPYPCYRKDYFQSSLYESQALLVCFFFALVLSVCGAIRLSVSEKESGHTMLMSIMGVNLHYHSLSWFITSLLEMCVTSSCIVLVLSAGRVLPTTDPSLLFVIVVDFGFSVLMFCYLVSKWFRSSSLAAVCGGIAYLITFMPFVIILSLEASLDDVQKVFTSLSMSTAFCYSLLQLGRREAMGAGANWKDIFQPQQGDHLTIGVMMIIVFCDGLLYFAIGYLIDWFYGIKPIKSNITECKSSNEKAGVSITNVTKVYGEGKKAKVALDNVSIELQRGQITTLLGHNGAGKTTLIKIITGMTKPTSGAVVIREGGNKKGGKADVSLCPQGDVLLEDLTPVEHLTLYARLRGAGSDEVHNMLSALSLAGHSHRPARQLSGGTRRRLCVSLSFIGAPALVVLDEPSTGVDPVARREIWSLIVRLKADRTVLLTTHHLDEAELLSDQVVILHKGQVHSVGSPLEIKRSLGNGYTLLAMFPKITDTNEDAPQIEELTKGLLSAVRQVVPNAQLVDVSGSEVELTLPFYDHNGLNNDFLRVCSVLESPLLGVRGYSLDCGSLDQVLQGICAPNYGTVSSNGSTETPSKSASTSSLRNDSCPLVPPEGAVKGTDWDQYKALLYKRFIHYRRNCWLLFLLLVLPSVFVCVAMSFSMIRPPADNEMALPVSPALYRNNTEFLVLNPGVYSDSVSSEYADSIVRILMDSYSYTNWTEEDTPNCKCGELKQTCDFSKTTSPNMLVLPDADTANDWLVKTQELYIEKRYGGYSTALKNNATNFIVWYNNKGHHAMPSFLNAMNSALVRRAANNMSAKIMTYTHPLKISQEQLSKSTLLQHVADAGISALLLLAYSLLPAGGAIYLVLERKTQQKRLQLLCGVTPGVYWAAAITWDMIIIVINIMLTACLLSAFGFPVFVARDNLPAICILLFLFGLSCNSLVHVLEKLFTDPSMANMILFCGNTFVGLSGIAILLILDIISESDKTDNARWWVHKLLLVCPQFALTDALVEVARNTVQAQVLTRFGMDTYVSPLKSTLILKHYLMMIIMTVILQVINWAIETDQFDRINWFKSKYDPIIKESSSEDVLAERKRVLDNINVARPVGLHTIGNINAGFVPCEGKKPSPVSPPGGDAGGAVRAGRGDRVSALTIGVPRGQCTALLGENGAGKSTTFSMLTGEIKPSYGTIYLNGKPADRKELCSGLISYCPQNDAIDQLLTVRETLRFYCRLRGIDDEEQVIERTMSKFDLQKYAEVSNHTLSGGNKRKLCTAVAFMGRTSLVLLDEPTSGMDPTSSQAVCAWSRAGGAAGGRGLLVSSHALRDAARLADRIALMRRGELVAIADTQDCYQRFGGGYIVGIRSPSVGSVWAGVRARLPSASVRASHHHALQVYVPTDLNGVRTTLSDIFRVMAELQSSYDIEDFIVNQSSLDEMFISFSDKKDGKSEVQIEPIPLELELRRNSVELNSVTSL